MNWRDITIDAERAINKIRFELVKVYHSTVPECGNYLHKKNILNSLWIIEKGGVTLSVNKKRYDIPEGNIVFCGMGMTKSQRFIPESKMLSMHFVLKNNYHLNMVKEESLSIIPSKEMKSLCRLSDKLVKTVFKNKFDYPVDAIGYNIIRNQWLEQFMNWCIAKEMIIQHAKIPDKRVLQAMKILSDQKFCATIDYQYLKSEIGIGRVQLDRLFKSYAGVSPKEYTNAIVLQKAHNLLMQSEESVKSISFKLGFKTVQHFSKWFTRQSGLSPQSHREISC